MGADAHVEERLDRLFGRLQRLTSNELMMLRAIWEEQETLPRQLAWRSALRVVKHQGRDGLLEDARARLGAWINNYLSATAIEYGNFLIDKSGLAAGNVRQAALPPILDAVVGTLAADGLDATELTILLEPLTVLTSKDSSATGAV